MLDIMIDQLCGHFSGCFLRLHLGAHSLEIVLVALSVEIALRRVRAFDGRIASALTPAMQT
jgi:hypothetical protein